MTCPFCGLDPFEYVDIGVGFEAVGITCCNLGWYYFDVGPDHSHIGMTYEAVLEINQEMDQYQARLNRINEGVYPIIETPSSISDLCLMVNRLKKKYPDRPVPSKT